MPFTFIGVYVCLTDFILQNKETRNHPSRHPPPKKKKRKKITRSHVPGAVASEDLEALPWFASPAVGTRACCAWQRGCLPDQFAVRGDRLVPDDAGD